MVPAAVVHVAEDEVGRLGLQAHVSVRVVSLAVLLQVRLEQIIEAWLLEAVRLAGLRLRPVRQIGDGRLVAKLIVPPPVYAEVLGKALQAVAPKRRRQELETAYDAAEGAEESKAPLLLATLTLDHRQELPHPGLYRRPPCPSLAASSPPLPPNFFLPIVLLICKQDAVAEVMSLLLVFLRRPPTFRPRPNTVVPKGHTVLGAAPWLSAAVRQSGRLSDVKFRTAFPDRLLRPLGLPIRRHTALPTASLPFRPSSTKPFYPLCCLPPYVYVVLNCLQSTL